MMFLSILEICRSHLMLSPKQLQRSTILHTLIIANKEVPALPEFRTNGLESETNDDSWCQIHVHESRALSLAEMRFPKGYNMAKIHFFFLRN